MTDETKKPQVAYVPFKTFLAAIEGFERHMPTQIDTSVWPTYSGAIKSQLLAAFKFLKLVDENGNPTNTLKTLVLEKNNRKPNLRKILSTSYPSIVGAGLPNMTPKMFEELISAYGMGGETQKKVTSFFIKAAKYSELPMSPLLLRKARAASGRKKKGSETLIDDARSIYQQNNSLSQGTSKTVELKSGGKLTLILSANFLELSNADREFVNGVTDMLQNYKGQKEKIA